MTAATHQTDLANAREPQIGARLLRLREVQLLVGLGRSTIYARMEAGTFPRSRSLGGGVVRWRGSDVLAWIDACPVSGQEPS